MVIPPSPPLPPLRATWSGMATSGESANLQDAKIVWGALHVSASQIFILPSITKPQSFRIDGGFQATRGFEKLRGESLTLDVNTQLLRGNRVSILQDVLRVDTKELTRNTLGISFKDIVVSDNVPGERKTLSITASALSYNASSGQWNVHNLGISLYKSRVLTVPNVRFQTGSTAAASRATRFQIPLSARQSAISGPVATVAYASQPAPGIGAAFVFEQTAKRGDSSSVALSYETANQNRQRTEVSDTDSNGLPLGDFAPILMEPKTTKRDTSPRLLLPSVMGPAIGPVGTSAVSVTLANRQEVIRRYKSVLIDHRPLLALSSSWVLGPSAIEAHFETGNRLETDLQSITQSYRNKSSVRLRTSVPVNRVRIPFEVQTVHVVATDIYSYTQFSTELIPKRIGSHLSAALSVRDIHGRATYYSDVLEAPSELQFRMNTPIAGWQLAVGSRVDLTSSRFFDTEFVLAAPGRVIRPEVRYRTRGNQIAINIGMPFFSL